MNYVGKERKTDAAIALIGLGKVFPHVGVEGICKECGHDVTQDRVCYAKVPDYGRNILDASDLLNVMYKEAPNGIEVKWDKDRLLFEFRYKGKHPLGADDMIFLSQSACPGIKVMAVYHFGIDINEVCKKCDGINYGA